jgi:hypothetical protein
MFVVALLLILQPAEWVLMVAMGAGFVVSYEIKKNAERELD